MPLIGRKLLQYEISAKLGEGGMGEVWRARDTALDREAAIKTLPGALAQDAERLARFEREAKLLASLNHPNIASVYGLHEAEGERFIAMEFVGGEDLAQRLARGAVPVDDAIEIGLGIARALEAAHSNGVVHRDLKPANVRIAADGTVKVLDFGLAKAFDTSSGMDSASLSLSPTLTAGYTVAGVILGTAAYMAPEQARGRAVDRRADIWAFGVVVYEMLTGRRLFSGETVSDVLAEVIKTEPDWAALPDGTPPGIRRLLGRCLRKDPDRRLHDAADARIAIEDALAGTEAAEIEASARQRRTSPLSLLSAVVIGLVAGAMLWSLLGPATSGPETPETNPVRRSQIPLPSGEPLTIGPSSLAISPDGSTVALAAGHKPETRIYLRRLDSLEMEAVPGTEAAEGPFFSPDSDRLAFFAAGELKTVSLRGGGGEITVLGEAPVSGDGAWLADGWIYFIYGESRLARIHEEGGKRELLGEVGDVHHIAPLPDARGLLLTVQPPGAPSNRKDTATIAVLLPDGSTVKPILEGGHSPRYLSGGHLVFMRGGGLFAVPFDLERLEASPPAVSVLPRVVADSIWAMAHYDIAEDGTLIYVPGGDYARTIPTWVDLESGEEEPLPIPAGIYNTFNLSPDGAQLAIQDASGAQDHIHIYDSRRGSFQRLTLEGANVYPVWSHDGREVFFASSRDGRYRLYRQPVDGSAPASRLLTEEQGAPMETDLRWPASVTPDGRYLMVMTWAHPVRGGDIWKVPLDGGNPEPVLATEGNEIIPQISPDGRWMAHLSNRTGSYQILIRPFPEVGQREWIASGAEGFDARWSPDGGAVLYREGWTGVMKVQVADGDSISPGIARRVIDLDFHDSAGSSFAVSPDGRRILVNKPVEFSAFDETPITLVTGWAGEVARLVASN